MPLSQEPGWAAPYQVIREVRRLFHRLANATDRLHAGVEVTAAQRAVLEALADDGPRTVPDLARRKGVTRQHVQVVANELLGAGFVEARSNPAHQRSSLLTLTAAGRQTFGAMRAREARLLTAVAKDLAGIDLVRVAIALRHLGDAVEERLDQVPPPASRR